MKNQKQIDNFVAACHFDVEQVRRVLAEDPGAAEVRATWDETPLQAAAQMGNREIMELLLEHGARLDVHAAAALGDAALVGQFLAADPEAAIAPGVHGLPALYFAAVSGTLEVAELLHSHGAAVNTEAGGNGPLHGAALSGNLEMVRWLLAHGADRTRPGYEGRLPVELARHYEPLYKFLLNKWYFDEAIDTHHEDVLAVVRRIVPEGVAGLLALAAGPGLERCIAAVRDGGTIAYPNGVPMPAGLAATAYNGVPNPAAFARLNAIIDANPIEVPIAAMYSLDDGAEAHRRLERGHVLGKIVIVVDVTEDVVEKVA